jgi:hypothetical protein
MAKKTTSTKTKVSKSEPEIVQVTNEGIEDFFDSFDDEITDEVESEESIKPISIFDHMNNLTINKVPWNNLPSYDKKSFNPYMITLWLGMDKDLLIFMNDMQIYSIGNLSPECFYKVLYEFLPQVKFYLKFIKAVKEPKYNDDLVLFIAKNFEVSKSQAIDYLDIYYMSDVNKLALYTLLTKFAKSDKEIKKLMDLKK